MVFPYFIATDSRIMLLHEAGDDVIFLPKKKGAIGIPIDKAEGFKKGIEQAYPEKNIQFYKMDEFLQLPEQK